MLNKIQEMKTFSEISHGKNAQEYKHSDISYRLFLVILDCIIHSFCGILKETTQSITTNIARFTVIKLVRTPTLVTWVREIDSQSRDFRQMYCHSIGNCWVSLGIFCIEWSGGQLKMYPLLWHTKSKEMI